MALSYSPTNYSTLNTQNLRVKTNVSVAVSQMAGGGSDVIVVFVRFNSQHAFPVEVDRGASVQTIHDQVAKVQDIPHDEFRIIFQGRILDNKANLLVRTQCSRTTPVPTN